MFFGFLVFLVGIAYLDQDAPEPIQEESYRPPPYVKPDLTRGGSVYRAFNTKTGLQYIGITRGSVEMRWFEHCHSALYSSKPSNAKFHRAIRKYGAEAFVVEAIDTADTGAELCAREAQLIRKMNTVQAGYNTVQPRDDLI